MNNITLGRVQRYSAFSSHAKDRGLPFFHRVSIKVGIPRDTIMELFPDVPDEIMDDSVSPLATDSSDIRARLRHLRDQRLSSLRGVLYETEAQLLSASKQL